MKTLSYPKTPHTYISWLFSLPHSKGLQMFHFSCTVRCNKHPHIKQHNPNGILTRLYSFFSLFTGESIKCLKKPPKCNLTRSMVSPCLTSFVCPHICSRRANDVTRELSCKSLSFVSYCSIAYSTGEINYHQGECR